VTAPAPVVPISSGGGGSYSISGGGYFVNSVVASTKQIPTVNAIQEAPIATTPTKLQTSTTTQKVSTQKVTPKKKVTYKKAPTPLKTVKVKNAEKTVSEPTSLWNKVVTFFKKILP
jgi:hypothetical protein